MLTLAAWNEANQDRNIGQFKTLAQALRACAEARPQLRAGEVLLLTGRDCQTGEQFDGFEPQPGETAANLMRGIREDEKEWGAMANTERVNLAKMAGSY